MNKVAPGIPVFFLGNEFITLVFAYPHIPDKLYDHIARYHISLIATGQESGGPPKRTSGFCLVQGGIGMTLCSAQPPLYFNSPDVLCPLLPCRFACPTRYQRPLPTRITKLTQARKSLYLACPYLYHCYYYLSSTLSSQQEELTIQLHCYYFAI